MKKIYYCIDCRKQLTATNPIKRCRKCHYKYQVKENNPNWKNLPILLCIDCGKELCKSARAMKCIRCDKCSILFQLKGNPENHPRFKTHHTEATKQKISIKAKKRLEDPTNHPMWQGGLSKLPYPIIFNNKLKTEIRERDNYKCKKCNITEKENKQLLDIHHIDYNKTNCKPENLVSVCHKCNSEVNANRDYWFAYFNYIVKEVI